MLPDLVLYFSLWRCCRKLSLEKHSSFTSQYISVVWSPSLFIIDHIHFQCNGFLLGVLLLSLSFLSEGHDFMGGLVFAVLLCFKHLFLIATLVYFVYLLRHYCRGPYRIVKFFTLGISVLAIFRLAFGPFIYYGQIIEGIRNLLNVVVDPATFAQAALPNILKKTTREFYEQALQTLCHAADICYNRAQKLDVMYCQSKPQGSMFLMIKINIPCFEDINDDVEFCGKLAKEESVIVLPGSLLGMKNWIRMSFAVSPCLLEEAWDRIESFCKRHAKSTQIIQMTEV